MDTTVEASLEKKNNLFWNELCGTQLAKNLGVMDASPQSLAKFDDLYFDYYPYLKKHLFLDEIQGKNVLEIGLGYGTVSQALALAGANYHGLDIAENPVHMAKHRLEQHNKTGDIRVGSMLTCPFPDNYFDFVVSIGCFHHTGDLQTCINQTHRILKKDGKAMIMVYNKFSLRQWTQWPMITARNLLMHLNNKSKRGSTEAQRRGYDTSSLNQGAPETEFFSLKEITEICSAFKTIQVSRENFDEDQKIKIWKLPLYKFKKRKLILNTLWTKYFGLDLYILIVK
ncbi:MAG: class I SAM-dependent methyltransferase [Gammaproteobacteria bacterium]|nr:class I SAM-dependent methyltransferase [Gammaproteobacteria bacterium]MCH9764355.1 class I SAM-dependent methyltransferase [Gammaproteobacteria bacterium]